MKNNSGRRAYVALGVVLTGIASVALAATFNLFSPANGILKGNPNTYVTTAAVSADVRALWSGTCDVTTFLRGDGTCSTPAGGVTGLANPTASVGLTAVNGVATTAMRSDAAPALDQSIAPTWTGTHTFSNASLAQWINSDTPLVSLWDSGEAANSRNYTIGAESGVFSINASSDNFGTNTAILAATRSGANVATVLFGNATSNPSFTFQGSGTVSATAFSGSGASLTSLSAGNISSGTLAVARGGIGVGTLTGIAKGNGTSAFTAAASSDVIGLWTGTCNSTTFLRADGSCQSAGSAAIGGSDTQIQYNNGGVFGGAASFTYNNSNGNVTSTVVASGGSNSYGLKITSNTPFWQVTESDAAADNGRWHFGAEGEQLLMAAVSDSGGAATNWLTVDRTGTTVDSLTTPGRIISSRSGGGSATGLQVVSGTPGWFLHENDASANNGKWDFVVSTEQLLFRLMADAETPATNWLTVDRTGTTVDSIGIFAPQVGAGVATGTTGSVTGCTTSPTTTYRSEKLGNFAWLRLNGVTCTSNASTFTIPSAVEASFRPAANRIVAGICTDNGNQNVACSVVIQSGGTVSFNVGASNAFTTSGTKGLSFNSDFSYMIN